jgi:hypothetical protein
MNAYVVDNRDYSPRLVVAGHGVVLHTGWVAAYLVTDRTRGHRGQTHTRTSSLVTSPDNLLIRHMRAGVS